MVYYFGVWSPSKLGHFLYDVNGSNMERRLPEDFPLRRWQCLDGGLLPLHGPCVEGQASFFFMNGWTFLSFWDCSGDKRPASNSTFLIRGMVPNFAIACEICGRHFPSIWNRFPFPVVERNF